MPLDPAHRSRQPAAHFDPGTHVTAGALRRNKLYVPPNVPDRAWIARAAVRPRTAEREVAGRAEYYLTADFLQPFELDGGPEDDPFAGPPAAPADPGPALLGPRGEPLTRNQ